MWCPYLSCLAHYCQSLLSVITRLSSYDIHGSRYQQPTAREDGSCNTNSCSLKQIYMEAYVSYGVLTYADTCTKYRSRRVPSADCLALAANKTRNRLLLHRPIFVSFVVAVFYFVFGSRRSLPFSLLSLLLYCSTALLRMPLPTVFNGIPQLSRARWSAISAIVNHAIFYNFYHISAIIYLLSDYLVSIVLPLAAWRCIAAANATLDRPVAP